MRTRSLCVKKSKFYDTEINKKNCSRLEGFEHGKTSVKTISTKLPGVYYQQQIKTY
jgi:hypothetical protein